MSWTLANISAMPVRGTSTVGPSRPRAFRPCAAASLASLVLTACDHSGATSLAAKADAQRGHPAGPWFPWTPSATTPQPHATPADFKAIRVLLKARAQALAENDRADFLATVDSADPAFVARQRTYFSNLQALRVSSVRYTEAHYALTPAEVPGPAPVLRPDITEHVFLSLTDIRPVATDVAYTFVRRQGGWLLAAEDTKEEGAQSRPWSGGAVAVAVHNHLVVVTDKSSAAIADDLAAAVRRDIESVSRLLHQPVRARLLVDATSTGQATRLNALGQGDAAAVTYPLAADPAAAVRRLAGWRIKINPHHAAKYMLDPVVLRHEVTHYVLRRVDVGTPTWVSEGVAEVSGYWPTQFSEQRVDPGFYRKLVTAPRQLPDSAVWANNPSVNYQVARAAADYLIRTYGTDRFVEFMRAFGHQGYAPTGDTFTRALLKKTYSATEAEVVTGAFALLRQLHH